MLLLLREVFISDKSPCGQGVCASAQCMNLTSMHAATGAAKADFAGPTSAPAAGLAPGDMQMESLAHLPPMPPGWKPGDPLPELPPMPPGQLCSGLRLSNVVVQGLKAAFLRYLIQLRAR